MNVMVDDRMREFPLPWAAATVVSLVASWSVPFFDAPSLVVFVMDALIVGLVQWALSRAGRPARPTVIAVSGLTSAIFLMGAVLAVVGVYPEWPMHIFLGGGLYGFAFGLLHGAAFVTVRSAMASQPGVEAEK